MSQGEFPSLRFYRGVWAVGISKYKLQKRRGWTDCWSSRSRWSDRVHTSAATLGQWASGPCLAQDIVCNRGSLKGPSKPWRLRRIYRFCYLVTEYKSPLPPIEGVWSCCQGFGGLDSCIVEGMVVNEWKKFSLFICVSCRLWMLFCTVCINHSQKFSLNDISYTIGFYFLQILWIL